MLFVVENSLKEVAPVVDMPVYIPETLQPFQIILICVLAGILLVWMVTFAWLAIRPNRKPTPQSRRVSSPAPVYTPVPATLHAFAQGSVPAASSEAVREVALER